MIRPSLKKEAVAAQPYLIWNAFVDLVAMTDYSDLSPEQRPAHLVFWYENEVRNGGHLQYFENRGTEHLAATIEALGSLGASAQQQILREAGDLWLSRPREPILTVQQYCDTEREGEFDELDRRFVLCPAELFGYLEAHLAQHQAQFVSVT